MDIDVGSAGTISIPRLMLQIPMQRPLYLVEVEFNTSENYPLQLPRDT